MNNFKYGDFVTYEPTKERGKIKSIDYKLGLAWVVYNCNNDWSNYEEYTGQATNIKDLTR